MFSGIVGVVVAALIAAGPDPTPNGALVASSGLPGVAREVFSALPPIRVPPEMLLQALPPPPEVVTRTTRYFGTVTIDHRAHLERRASCKRCHGPGPVSKIEFTPRVAHERCVGCHNEERRGPRDCKGCHAGTTRAPIVAERPAVVEPSTEEKARKLTVSGPGAVLAAAPAGAPGGAPEARAAPASAPSGTPQVTTTTSPTADEGQEPFQRIFQLGFAGGGELGFSIRLASRQEGMALEHSIDRLEGNGKARTLVLIGGGVAYPLERRLDLVAVGVCGLDALERPEATFMPALGARVGLEWLLERWIFHSASLSLTGVVDVARQRAMGRDVGGTNFYATLGTGFMIAGR